MFGWLTGSSRPVEAPCEESQSYLDDPPETPAPLFALRAFKSALFGTPRIDPEIRLTTPSLMDQDRKAGKRDHAAQAGHTNSTETGQKTDGECFAKPRAPSLLSPSKGILLTPGTGATRRKKVSFGGLALNDKASVEPSRHIDSVFGVDANKSSFAKPLPIDQHRQTNLTKALYIAKASSSKEKLDQITDDEASVLPLEAVNGHRAEGNSQDEVPDSSADTTIDLNQPFSRSGKHWKAEYEQYHKNSAREMREIIKYGQNVKSFAVKKDSEASELAEKLHLELSKVAAMEAKVSRLAAQLASTRVQGSEDAEQAKMVKELAKQTALAVRYKQKADRYRSSLLKKTSSVAQAENAEENALVQGAKPFSTDSPQNPNNAQEITSLRNELDRLQESAKLADEKAKVLEAENATLREAMSRLKAEAAGYETKRLTREADFQRKAAIMTSACEARLDQITAENQKLLRQLRLQEVPHGIARNQAMGFSESGNKSDPVDLADAAEASKSSVPKVISQSPKSTHRIKPLESQVDIWTSSAPGDGTNKISSVKKPTSDQESEHMESDIFSVLREIEQNTISERGPGDPLPSFNRALIPRTPAKLHKRHHRSELLSETTPQMSSLLKSDSENAPLTGPQPVTSSASKRMQERRSTLSSPRPSMLNFASSPPKTISNSIPPDPNSQPTSLEANMPKSSSAPVFPVGSVLAATSRKSSLARVRRQPNLPAERTAAARARLKERSMEKSMTGGRRESRAWRKVKADGKGEIVGIGSLTGGGSVDHGEE